MQGACVYINNQNNPTLIMYKEFISNNVLYVYYSNHNFTYKYITTRQLSNIIPKDSIHILTKLPMDYNSLYNTLDLWKNLAINTLLNYNIQREKNFIPSKTDFYKCFQNNLI